MGKHIESFAQKQPEKTRQFLRDLPQVGAYDIARHEIMHCLIYPSDVVYVTVIPDGDTLGVASLTRVDDVARAAGIVHGRGSSHDELMIRLNNPDAPDLAVSSAVATARNILMGKEGLIDLMARELAQRGTLNGSQFNELLKRAQDEINGTREEPFDWTLFFGEKPEQNQEEEIFIDVSDDDPFSLMKLIPKHGTYELSITTKDGKKVYVYENGVHVKTEIWSLTPVLDESENYGEVEILEPQYEKIREEYISIFFPSSLPKVGVIYDPANIQIERSDN